MREGGARKRCCPRTGTWFDRTLEDPARRKGFDSKPLDYAYPQTVVLSPLPSWALPEPTLRQAVRDLACGIEEE
jgi:hypothetical protein